MERRTFLKLAGVAPIMVAWPGPMLAEARKAAPSGVRSLVLVELKGGNDGLNTLIPFKDQRYRQLRPGLALADKQLLPLDGQLAMQGAMQAWMPLWDEGELGWLQGVGYANPNRSHFRAIEIWDTGETLDDGSLDGWVPPLFKSKQLKGVAVDSSLGPLYADDMSTIGLLNPQQFAKQGRKIRPVRQDHSLPALGHVLEVQDSVNELAGVFLKSLSRAPEPANPFPKHAFGRAVQAVYSMMVAGLDIPAYKVSLGSFDTHTNQLGRQGKLLAMLADTLAILRSNLKAAGYWDNTLIMSYSEFGRRAQENASGGTDHGTAAPHFVLGGKVKGGLHGRYPSLADLDERGDLKYTLDFRDVYAAVARDWWKLGDSTKRPLPDFIRV